MRSDESEEAAVRTPRTRAAARGRRRGRARELQRAFDEKLAESGLEQSDAKALGLQLLAADEVGALAPNLERRGGIRISYYDARGREVKGVYRVRYLEAGTGFASTVVAPRRYAQPRGTPPKAYFPKTIDWRSVIENQGVPITIVEGELKAACLAKHGFKTIGLGGVDAWRSRKRGIRLLPELADLQWVNRLVYLAFDSDIVAKLEVRRALHALARELKRRGADVREVRIPELPGLEKVGADDFIVLESAAAFQELVDAAEPAIVVDEDHLTHLTYVDWANEHLAVVSLGGKARVMRETRDPETGLVTEEFLTRADARLLFENRTWEDPNGNKKPVVPAWLRHPDRVTYDGIVFAPEGTESLPEAGRRRYYNLWRGFAVEPEPGDWSTFEDHLRVNVCAGDEDLYQWLLAWMARIAQRPWEKTGVAVALRGRKGTGKTKVGQRFGGLFHPAHCLSVAHERHLLGNFNAHQRGKILIQAEEAFWAGDKKAEGVLKDLITGGWVNLELKGVDVVRVRNLANLLITSNENWVVPASLDERRFAVFEVGDARAEDERYFGAIDREFEAGGAAGLLFDLLSLDLSKHPDPRRAPNTPGLAEQKIAGLDALGKFWLECLVAGCIEGGFPGESWPETMTVEVFVERYRATRGASRSRLPGPTDPRDIGKRLRELCPGVQTRKASRTNEAGRRPKEFRLLPREVAREAFERHVGARVDWDTGEICCNDP